MLAADDEPPPRGAAARPGESFAASGPAVEMAEWPASPIVAGAPRLSTEGHTYDETFVPRRHANAALADRRASHHNGHHHHDGHHGHHGHDGAPPDEPPTTAEAQAAADEHFGALSRYDGTHHVLLCGGALVLGPQMGRLAATVAMLALPAPLMYAVVLPHAPAWLTVAHAVALLGTLWFLGRAATTDPGVVQRRRLATPALEEECPELPFTLDVAAVRRLRTKRRGKPDPGGVAASADAEVPVADGGGPVSKEQVRLRFCYTCRRYRGPRAHHCHVCGCCVDVFDHHCPWLGTCVGACNYGAFLWFLSLLQAFLFLSAFACVYVPAEVSARRGVAITTVLFKEMSAVPVVLLAAVLVLGVLSTALFVFHGFLVATSTTTMEHMRKIHAARGGSPFDRGVLANCTRFCGRFDTTVFTENYRQAECRVMHGAVSGALQAEEDAHSRCYRQGSGTTVGSSFLGSTSGNNAPAATLGGARGASRGGSASAAAAFGDYRAGGSGLDPVGGFGGGFGYADELVGDTFAPPPVSDTRRRSTRSTRPFQTLDRADAAGNGAGNGDATGHRRPSVPLGRSGSLSGAEPEPRPPAASPPPQEPAGGRDAGGSPGPGGRAAAAVDLPAAEAGGWVDTDADEDAVVISDGAFQRLRQRAHGPPPGDAATNGNGRSNGTTDGHVGRPAARHVDPAGGLPSAGRGAGLEAAPRIAPPTAADERTDSTGGAAAAAALGGALALAPRLAALAARDRRAAAGAATDELSGAGGEAVWSDPADLDDLDDGFGSGDPDGY